MVVEMKHPQLIWLEIKNIPLLKILRLLPQFIVPLYPERKQKVNRLDVFLSILRFSSLPVEASELDDETIKIAEGFKTHPTDDKPLKYKEVENFEYIEEGQQPAEKRMRRHSIAY